MTAEHSEQQILSLAFVGASLVARQDDKARLEIQALHDSGINREEVREIILQSYLHDGYATALEGMILLNDIWPGSPEPSDSPEFDNHILWRTRGRDLFSRIYGDVADKTYDNIAEASPELAEWMVVEGYGKVLGRGVLDTRTRELGTVAVLVLKRRPRQLYSHLRGALRTGCTAATIQSLLRRMEEELEVPEAIEEARKLLANFQK